MSEKRIVAIAIIVMLAGSLTCCSGIKAVKSIKKGDEALTVHQQDLNRSAEYQLSAGNWLPQNREAINNMIEKYGKDNAHYNPDNKPLAVFDFDNTCIYNDIGYAVFYYLI